MAVQGGLLASTLALREEEDVRANVHHKHNIFPTLAFLATKFSSYVILGVVLGGFGSALALSDKTRIVMQMAASIYMIVVAFDLLNVHPVFRYAIIQPPRFLVRLIRNRSKSKDLFAPAILGAMTVFIPCGTTLAMEALAISSGSLLRGGLIMGAFVLGTSPLFLGLGFITTVLGDAFRTRFLKLAAVGILYLGITSLNGALVLAGYPIQIDLSGGSVEQLNGSQVINGEQQVNIQVLPNGYSPNYVQIKAGLPVRLNLTAGSRLGCTSQFRIPSLGVSRNIIQNSTTTIEFTPLQKGKIIGTCSMGMFSVVMEAT